MIADVVSAHERSGRYFEADGTRSFVLDDGDGDPVVLMHGVPVSCFLYRKVIPELVSRGLRGVAFDLPGLGLAERPEDYDYSWTGLGRFSAKAVDALQLKRFHLVVHDIGGPVGFEVARMMPERIASLTLLNTIVDAHDFSRPWPMAPYAVPGLGKLWLGSTSQPLFRMLWRLRGVADSDCTPDEEIGAHLRLLKRGDRGAALLKIMRRFELTTEKTAHYRAALQPVPYPVQIVWGKDDPNLTIDKHGAIAARVAGVEIQPLPGGHFFQEEQPAAIAECIAKLAGDAS